MRAVFYNKAGGTYI